VFGCRWLLLEPGNATLAISAGFCDAVGDEASKYMTSNAVVNGMEM